MWRCVSFFFVHTCNQVAHITKAIPMTLLSLPESFILLLNRLYHLYIGTLFGYFGEMRHAFDSAPGPLEVTHNILLCGLPFAGYKLSRRFVFDY